MATMGGSVPSMTTGSGGAEGKATRTQVLALRARPMLSVSPRRSRDPCAKARDPGSGKPHDLPVSLGTGSSQALLNYQTHSLSLQSPFFWYPRKVTVGGHLRLLLFKITDGPDISLISLSYWLQITAFSRLQ